MILGGGKFLTKQLQSYHEGTAAVHAVALKGYMDAQLAQTRHQHDLEIIEAKNKAEEAKMDYLTKTHGLVPTSATVGGVRFDRPAPTPQVVEKPAAEKPAKPSKPKKAATFESKPLKSTPKRAPSKAGVNLPKFSG
jgi:hypothetical protein